MRNIITICQRELRSYFASPVAYGVMAFFAFLAGIFFFAIVQAFVRYSIQAQMGRPMPLDVNEMVIRQFLMNIAVINIFLLPMLTMRLFAEEKRSGTIELLATSPVRDIEIIIGKWLAAVLLYALLLAISLIDVALLFAYGHPDIRPVLVGYLGLLLQGSALIALGTFISSLTKNQIIAGVGAFATALVLWIIEWLTNSETGVWAKVVGYLSIVQHFEPSFSKGVLDTKDIVFYISMIVLGLFLTSRSLESLRWRT